MESPDAESDTSATPIESPAEPAEPAAPEPPPAEPEPAAPEPEPAEPEPPPAEPEAASVGYAPDQRRSWVGVWAFVLSLLGMIGLLPIIGSVLGVVLGRVAIRQASTRAVRGGRGLAMAAFVISLATLALITVSAATYALVLAFGPA